MSLGGGGQHNLAIAAVLPSEVNSIRFNHIYVIIENVLSSDQVFQSAEVLGLNSGVLKTLTLGLIEAQNGRIQPLFS